MTKNNLLNIAIILSKLAQLGYIITFLVLTFIFIHFQIDNSSYKDTYLKEKIINDKSSFNLNLHKESKFTLTKKTLTDNEVFSLKKIEPISLYIQYLKYTLIIFLSFFSFKEFEKIIKSVKKLQTFRKDNVKSFRKIGKYVALIFILTSYTYISFKNGYLSNINISFSFLGFIILPFIMAEIFKEGKKLQEENDLTI